MSDFTLGQQAGFEQAEQIFRKPIQISVGEDGIKVLRDDRTCTIGKDEDSFKAVSKLLLALGIPFTVIEAE